MTDHFAPAQGDDSGAKWLIGATDPETTNMPDELSAAADAGTTEAESVAPPAVDAEELTGDSAAADRAAGTS